MIRELRKNDIPYIYNITLRSLDESYSPDIFNYFRMQWPSGQLVACDVVGIPVGYINAIREDDKARIMMFAVSPEYRGHGVGKRLLTAFRNKALMEGVRTMTLEVRDTNGKAIRFYERNGFRPYGVKENFYNDGGSAVTMVAPVQLNI